ncbi:hypothetical protein PLICBS_004044 [Purpureocillium lilacinum]|uniref:uncharacterized protein n=1 Tax=Purpureocillium lilacinum TaxID=33203 RepID=UPI0020886BB5|nr:hypothetical protein PLICBS_004044 [Purpureocillium lilacinum]
MGIIPSVQIGRDEAICYFHDRFAWVSASRYFVFSSSQPPALLNMAAALGLASFSFTRKSTAMQRAAAAEYSTALQSINHMLADPATATLDSTLAVVILMSFFELSTSLIHKIPVSQALVDCTRLAMEISTPSQNHGEHVFIITGEVANLRAALEENPVINDTAPVFDAVDKLTARLREWRLMAPVDWKYDTMEVDEQSPGAETWYGFIKPVGGRYSIYSGDHVVVGWSNYRMSCILLAELLLGLLKRQVMASSPPSTAALAKCRALRRTMDQMATDICASVPYLLGLKTSAAGGALPDLSGAYMVLMPLWVAACVEGPGHPLRHSAMFLLEVLARRVGIRHASLQRHFLVSVEGMAEWLDNFPETR